MIQRTDTGAAAAPDLLLLDLNLSRYTGEKILERFSEQPEMLPHRSNRHHLL